MTVNEFIIESCIGNGKVRLRVQTLPLHVNFIELWWMFETLVEILL